MENHIYSAIIAILLVILIVYLYKTHKRWVICVCLRTVIGTALILVLNYVFKEAGISCAVGINQITIPVVAFLGVPGLALLFGGTYFFRL